MLMRWPSGSALRPYFAATTLPAPRRFSTMTGTPRLAGHLLGDDARHRVGGAAGRDARDETHGLARKGLRIYGRKRKCEQQCKDSPSISS